MSLILIVVDPLETVTEANDFILSPGDMGSLGGGVYPPLSATL